MILYHNMNISPNQTRFSTYHRHKKKRKEKNQFLFSFKKNLLFHMYFLLASSANVYSELKSVGPSHFKFSLLITEESEE